MKARRGSFSSSSRTRMETGDFRNVSTVRGETMRQTAERSLKDFLRVIR